MTDKIFITDEEFKQKSSEIAEKEHHKECEFECCGSHNDFLFDGKHLEKCPKCGMTEEIQDKHNDQVWAIIDNAEADLLDKYSIMWKHEDAEECDHSDYIDYEVLGNLGKMESDKIDGVYNIPFFCPNCNHFVKEVYNYEGVEVMAWFEQQY